MAFKKYVEIDGKMMGVFGAKFEGYCNGFNGWFNESKLIAVTYIGQHFETFYIMRLTKPFK